MATLLSRRKFLAQCGIASLALAQTVTAKTARQRPIAVGRVTISLIYVYIRPSYSSERVDQRTRDQLLNLLEEVQSPDGPAHNPLWYRVDGGFVHSGYVQRVPFLAPNRPLSSIPAQGLLAEVTVPYTRSFFSGHGSQYGTTWQPLYRLYYQSLHWVHAICEGPDGEAWYRLSDAKNDSIYCVPAADLRPLAWDEYSPTARDVPADSKRIVVSIEAQTLTAYEGDNVVLHTSIASGVPSSGELAEGEIPTDTPRGYWRITQKMPSRHMGDGRLTAEIEAYELPGVPWTMAFHETGAALHGSYWHNNFGRRMSHGCVNMRNHEALWLFRWSDPIYEPLTWYVNGLGTLVQVT